MTSVVIEAFRPVERNTLRGFARVRFPSGLILDEVGIHVAAADGHAWANPPGRPMVAADGVAVRDQRTGKIRYQGLIAFSTVDIRNAWSDAIVEAVREKHPEALR